MTPMSKHDDRSIDGEFDKSLAAYPTSSYDIDSDHEDRSVVSPGSPQTSISSDNAGTSAGNIFSKMFR